MAAIHQLLAGFSRGDAISNEALALRGIFRQWGRESDIFSEARRILPELRKEARDVAQCAGACGPRDVALLHLSIGSPVNEAFAALCCRKAVLYHNVTPPRYFQAVNRKTAANLALGIEQVKRLAGAAEVNLADSQFNAAEITALGYARVAVLPLVLDFESLAAPPDRAVLRQFGDSRTTILFVGRGAPNKRIEDLLLAFYFFRRHVDPNARLIHVGSYAGTELYHALLLARVRELGLENVHFTGSVPQAQLNAYYRIARVFLSMSEHEGFCIPLIESMLCGLPVLAHAAGAVPETMDGAGVLFREKQYEAVAELMGKLAEPGPLRDAVVQGQRERAARYRQRNLAAELRVHLAPLL
jgi:L-malate glycosyltransferase